MLKPIWSELTSSLAESRIRVFSTARDWLILARRLFSIRGLFACNRTVASQSASLIMTYVASVPTWNYCSCMIFRLILSQSLLAVLHQLEDFGIEVFVICHIKLMFVMTTVLVVNEKKLIFRLTQRCSWGLRSWYSCSHVSWYHIRKWPTRCNSLG